VNLDLKQETRNLKLEEACFEPINKKVFAKNLPVVAERDSFFGRRTKEDRRQNLEDLQRRKRFTTSTYRLCFLRTTNE